MILIFIIISCLALFSLATPDCQNCGTIRGQLTNFTQLRFPHASFEHELANVEIALNPGNRKTTINPKREFIFYDVPPGSYRLDVHSLSFYFDPVILDIIPRGADGSDIIAVSIDPQAKTKKEIQHPLMLSSKGSILYFEIEEEFSIASIFKSGYGIMIGVMILMMFCAKNMPSMDEMEDMNRAPNESVQQEERRQPAPQTITRGERKRQ